MTIKASKILAKLNTHAENYSFPVLNNIYFIHGAIKMSVYLSDKDWVFVFQQIGLPKNRYEYVNDFSIISGSNLVSLDFDHEEKIAFSRKDGASFWTDDRKFIKDQDGFNISVGDEDLWIEINPESISEEGRRFYSQLTDEVRLLRIMCDAYKHKIFLSPEIVLTHILPKGANFSLFADMDSWNHPDIADDELPSLNSCFISIANAIEKGNRDLIDCKPNNIHWSNWIIQLPIE